jgi:integrase
MIKTKFVGVFYRDTIGDERVYYITYKNHGKKVTEKIGSNKEGVTAAYASKMRSKRTSVERLKDDAPMLASEKAPTFGECFALYIKSIENKSDTNNTINRYELHVKDTFENVRISEITTDMLEAFRKQSLKKVSFKTKRAYAPKTIIDWINIVGTVCNFMIDKKGLRINNPAHSSKMGREKVDNDRERYLEVSEIKLLWDWLDKREGAGFKSGVTENMKVFLALSLSTGARLTSVLTITKSDINLQNNSVTIKNHKSNRTYRGFIHPSYKHVIEARVSKLRQIDYVVNGSATQISRTAISKVFAPIFEELFNSGLDKGDAKRRVVLHTLRHTFASQLAIAGTPIYTIMKLMDHADINQTIRYAKLSPDNGRDNVFKLEF